MVLGFIALATFIATMLGGFFALYLKDKLHLILGFSAGAIVGVTFFDLLPEALNLAGGSYEFSSILSITALGFVCYLLLDRTILFHASGEENAMIGRGEVGAVSLSLHSFLDGIGIGLAFQVGTAVGTIVAVAVLAHDFSDGINTVNMILRNGGHRRKALSWLSIDALAPVLGIFATLFFGISDRHLGLWLALFAGFFLYIGASDLIPESHHLHPRFWTSFTTLLGVAVLYIAIRVAGL